jgi:hypothetical protein
MRLFASRICVHSTICECSRGHPYVFEISWLDDGSVVQVGLSDIPQLGRRTPRRIIWPITKGFETAEVPRSTINLNGFATWDDFGNATAFCPAQSQQATEAADF